MVWKDAESIFQRSFHGRCRCWIVRSLLCGRVGRLIGFSEVSDVCHKHLTRQRSQLAVQPVHTIGTLRSNDDDPVMMRTLRSKDEYDPMMMRTLRSKDEYYTIHSACKIHLEIPKGIHNVYPFGYFKVYFACGVDSIIFIPGYCYCMESQSDLGQAQDRLNWM